MKRLVSLLLILALVLTALYAEGVDEVEQVEEEKQLEGGHGLSEEGEGGETGPDSETNTNSETETGSETETDSETVAEEAQESETHIETQSETGRVFAVMDEDGTLIASSGAGAALGLSSMTQLLLMTALDEKYASSSDMGTIKVGEDFESPYGGGLDIIAGEEFKALDLYKALYLISPDDAALLFALRDLGGEEGAISAMKSLASKIGLGSTTIVSLYGESNTSTAYDIARLFLYNYKQSERFREASSLPSLSIAETETTGARELQSSSAFLLDTGMSLTIKEAEEKVYNQAVIAAKTVYLNDGSHILVSMIKKEDRPLIFVTAGSSDIESAYLFHRELQLKLMNEYETVTYLKANTPRKVLKGGGDKTTSLEMSPRKDVVLILPKNYDIGTKLECRYQAGEGAQAKIAIYKEGALYKSVEASASELGAEDSYLGEVKKLEVEKTGQQKALDILKLVFKIVLILVLWLGAIALNRMRIRAKKRRLRDRARKR